MKLEKSLDYNKKGLILQSLNFFNEIIYIKEITRTERGTFLVTKITYTFLNFIENRFNKKIENLKLHGIGKDKILVHNIYCDYLYLEIDQLKYIRDDRIYKFNFLSENWELY